MNAPNHYKYYLTNHTVRECSKKFTDTHDKIQLITPTGTRDRIKALGIKPKKLFYDLAKAYIDTQSVS